MSFSVFGEISDDFKVESGIFHCYCLLESLLIHSFSGFARGNMAWQPLLHVYLRFVCLSVCFLANCNSCYYDETFGFIRFWHK